jgi:hypothetical protein
MAYTFCHIAQMPRDTKPCKGEFDKKIAFPALAPSDSFIRPALALRVLPHVCVSRGQQLAMEHARHREFLRRFEISKIQKTESTPGARLVNIMLAFAVVYTRSIC